MINGFLGFVLTDPARLSARMTFVPSGDPGTVSVRVTRTSWPARGVTASRGSMCQHGMDLDVQLNGVLHHTTRHNTANTTWELRPSLECSRGHACV